MFNERQQCLLPDRLRHLLVMYYNCKQTQLAPAIPQNYQLIKERRKFYFVVIATNRRHINLCKLSLHLACVLFRLDALHVLSRALRTE